jgi:hypothetical protein
MSVMNENKLWLVYSPSYSGTTAYIKAKDIKDAIAKFEENYTLGFMTKPTPLDIERIEYLGYLNE